jgi:hypothetical protein
MGKDRLGGKGSTPCQFFGAPGGCSRGDKCWFVHVIAASHKALPHDAAGQALCRFGFACTRVGCWHKHPHGRKLDGDSDPSAKDVLGITEEELALRSKKNSDRFAGAAQPAVPEKRKAHAGVLRHPCRGLPCEWSYCS